MVDETGSCLLHLRKFSQRGIPNLIAFSLRQRRRWHLLKFKLAPRGGSSSRASQAPHHLNPKNFLRWSQYLNPLQGHLFATSRQDARGMNREFPEKQVKGVNSSKASYAMFFCRHHHRPSTCIPFSANHVFLQRQSGKCCSTLTQKFAEWSE